MTSMEESQLAVSLTLRHTETCIAAAQVWDESQPSTVTEPRDQRRVLAVVSHSNSTGDDEHEEGCLFVMKYKSPTGSELHPYLLFPVGPELTTSLKQSSNGTSSLNASEFKVTLNHPKGSEITLGSNQIHTLSAVLEETRRLKTLVASSTSDSDVDGSDLRHSEWLHFYLSHKASRILPSQKPTPDDIRSVRQGPKLSASSAGLLLNEDGDIALIRDQWVRAQLTAHKSEYSRGDTIRLRIGTFNVNEKAPSESLTSWLRAPSTESARKSSESNAPADATSSTDVPSPEVNQEVASAEIDTEAPVQDSLSLVESTVPSSVALTSCENLSTHSTPPSSIAPGHSGDLPDLFVLGFQELDLSTEALLYGTSTLKADTWIAAVFEALGKDADDYVQLASKQLVGVLVVVIARKDMRPIVKEVSMGMAGVGIMGVMGNKGATTVRLQLNSTILTFVCSHLAAFDENFEKRNSDFSEICRKLQCPITWKGPRNTRSLMANIWETDILFWLGGMSQQVLLPIRLNISSDLNYRIDLPDEEVRSLLTNKLPGSETNTLLAYDQLRTAARNKRAFIDFFEHEINFPPTYRFAEPPLDEMGFDLKRRPAWTDRILYLAADPAAVSQISYQSHREITLSDHRPVSADYNVQLESHDAHELHRVAMSIFKTLGDFEDSDVIPSVVLLDVPEVDLGDVYYSRPISRTVRVKNEGKVACAFRFLPLEPGSAISKEWLKIKPINGILLPGETETITLTVKIDKRTASFLNHGHTALSDNIILHIAKGTDHLITVSGSYQPTCFANSLAWLVRSPGPIRGQGPGAKLLPEANTLSAPRELMFLVEWLITNATGVDDLFLIRGEGSLVDLIRDHLDTQNLDSRCEIDFPEGTDTRAIALAFAEAMLQFLDSLTEPVIPWVLHPRCALAVDREDAFEILDHVPGFARNVYVTVTAFLHFIGQSGGPDMPAQLARVFADVLLRDDPRAPPGIPLLTPLGKRNFLLHTIS